MKIPVIHNIVDWWQNKAKRGREIETWLRIAYTLDGEVYGNTETGYQKWRCEVLAGQRMPQRGEN